MRAVIPLAHEVPTLECEPIADLLDFEAVGSAVPFPHRHVARPRRDCVGHLLLCATLLPAQPQLHASVGPGVVAPFGVTEVCRAVHPDLQHADAEPPQAVDGLLGEGRASHQARLLQWPVHQVFFFRRRAALWQPSVEGVVFPLVLGKVESSPVASVAGVAGPAARVQLMEVDVLAVVLETFFGHFRERWEAGLGARLLERQRLSVWRRLIRVPVLPVLQPSVEGIARPQLDIQAIIPLHQDVSSGLPARPAQRGAIVVLAAPTVKRVSLPLPLVDIVLLRVIHRLRAVVVLTQVARQGHVLSFLPHLPDRRHVPLRRWCLERLLAHGPKVRQRDLVLDLVVLHLTHRHSCGNIGVEMAEARKVVLALRAPCNRHGSGAHGHEGTIGSLRPSERRWSAGLTTRDRLRGQESQLDLNLATVAIMEHLLEPPRLACLKVLLEAPLDFPQGIVHIRVGAEDLDP
mmetsp:Transcript_55736/g.155344  ORF Transcript_55736/g.155344 Transcript_55736/m.155344 type:complete len:461 (-) Transcript_55736:1069-2451(-)